MQMYGNCIYKGAFSGVSSKTEKPYEFFKFLDEDAEEFFTFFVSEELFRACQKIEKNTHVCLTVEMTMSNRKYAKLIDVQPVAE